MDNDIFQDLQKNKYNENDIKNALINLGANKAKILYIHTDIGFGKPLMKKKQYIAKLYEILLSLGVKTLIFPTYTFSFCNKLDFDVQNSPSSMGLLNEFARTRPNTFRTNDPLLSVCVVGEVPQSFHNLSNHSCGKGSHFEIMSQSDENMFLFFGAKPTECFTFLHFCECVYQVPYRYDKLFCGLVKDHEKISQKEYYLYTLYDSVVPHVSIEFQNDLEQKNILKKLPLGEKELMLVKGKSVYEHSFKCFDENINCILKRPYDTFALGTNYEYKNVKSVK